MSHLFDMYSRWRVHVAKALPSERLSHLYQKTFATQKITIAFHQAKKVNRSCRDLWVAWGCGTVRGNTDCRFSSTPIVLRVGTIRKCRCCSEYNWQLEDPQTRFLIKGNKRPSGDCVRNVHAVCTYGLARQSFRSPTCSTIPLPCVTSSPRPSPEPKPRPPSPSLSGQPTRPVVAWGRFISAGTGHVHTGCRTMKYSRDYLLGVVCSLANINIKKNNH